MNLEALPAICRGLEVTFPAPLGHAHARLMATLGVAVRYAEHHPDVMESAALADPPLDLSAHAATTSQDCRTPGCPGEADKAMGRFAGLCRRCARQAMQDPEVVAQRKAGNAASAQQRTAIANGPVKLSGEQVAKVARQLADRIDPQDPDAAARLREAADALKQAARDVERVRQGVGAAVKREQEIRERFERAYRQLGVLARTCGFPT